MMEVKLEEVDVNREIDRFLMFWNWCRRKIDTIIVQQ
jgi:hypothetical protein